MLRRVHGHDVSRFWRDLLLPFFAFALTVSVLPLSHTCSSSLDPHSQAPAGLRTDVTSPVRTTYGRFVATVAPRLSRPRPGRTAPRSRAPLAATVLLWSAPLPALCCTQQRLSAPAGSHARLALPRPAPPPFPGGRARAEVHKAGTGQRRTITGMASRSLRSQCHTDRTTTCTKLTKYSFTVFISS